MTILYYNSLIHQTSVIILIDPEWKDVWLLRGDDANRNFLKTSNDAPNLALFCKKKLKFSALNKLKGNDGE